MTVAHPCSNRAGRRVTWLIRLPTPPAQRTTPHGAVCLVGTQTHAHYSHPVYAYHSDLGSFLSANDTIRDAILTCARKPTCVSLIYRTEPTTKKCKNRKKTKSRKQICPEITVNSPGNPCSKYLSKKKGRAIVGRICREGRF